MHLPKITKFTGNHYHIMEQGNKKIENPKMNLNWNHIYKVPDRQRVEKVRKRKEPPF